MLRLCYVLQNIKSKRNWQVIEKCVFFHAPVVSPYIFEIVSDLFVQVMEHTPGKKVLCNRLDAIPEVGFGSVDIAEKRGDLT